MSFHRSGLDLFAAKLASRTPLDADDHAAIAALPCAVRDRPSGTYIVREGEVPSQPCSFLVEGYVTRHKLTTEGSRQIIGVRVPGDLLDLQHLFLTFADHNIQTLTPVKTLEIDRTALRALIGRRIAIATALWIDALIEASAFRDWIVNIGRRDARTRVAHLLCEFASRLETSGMAEGPPFVLPMTQEQIGDATGLTSVHVNRTLKALEADGVIRRSGRSIGFDDWERIRLAADFSPRYLHLDQGPTGRL